MEDIEFQKDGMKKFTQKKFKKALLKEGWKIVGEEPEVSRGPGRPPKQVTEDDNS